MLAALQRLLRPVETRLANLVARAVVRRADDAAKLQLLQLGLLEGEVREGVEHFQAYGFTSVPLAGAEVVVLFPGGRRDHGLVVASGDRRYRLAGLVGGEVALFTDEGDSIEFKRGRILRVLSPHIELGAAAADAALKGTAYASAEATFLTALGTYVAAIQGVADPSNAATPVLASAIGAFTTATTSALSTKVKVA